MKAVLISIQPKWCARIASGEKSIEVRKTQPKLEPPFKCYIYETQGKAEIPWMDEDGHMIFRGRGIVIGEFVCDKIFDICIEISKPDDLPGYPFPCTGLTDKEILQYLGNGKTGYGWHISNLVIYDKPMEVWWLQKPSDGKEFWPKDISIKRPPQSWCYVEEMIDNA